MKKKYLPRIVGSSLSCRWYISYYIEGKRHRIYSNLNSLHTLSERKYRAAELVAELKERLDLTPTETTTEIKKKLTGALLRKKSFLRKKSYQSYQSKINKFFIWLGDRQTINENDAKNFLDDLSNQGLSNTTRNAYQVTLKLLWEEAYNGFTPFDGIKRLREQRRKGALYFGAMQIEVLKEVIKERDKQLWLFCQFIYYTFIRPGELRQLKIGDLLLGESKILVRMEISKNRKEQYVRIPDPFLRELYNSELNYFDLDCFIFSSKGDPGKQMMGINNFSNRHRKILRELRFDSRHKLYSWKHTGVVALVRAGCHIKQLQIQLRHHSLDQVNEYLRDLGLSDTEELGKIFPKL